MSDPLRTAEDYQLFLYTILDAFPSVRHSTLTFVRRGASLARVSGELHFDHAIRLIVRERLTFNRLPVAIDWYGYDVVKRSSSWYDCQPHPNASALQATHPHHKHQPPDIKHNRIPAPEMSFSRPNLPFLIDEIDELMGRIAGDLR